MSSAAAATAAPLGLFGATITVDPGRGVLVEAEGSVFTPEQVRAFVALGGDAPSWWVAAQIMEVGWRLGWHPREAARLAPLSLQRRCAIVDTQSSSGPFVPLLARDPEVAVRIQVTTLIGPDPDGQALARFLAQDPDRGVREFVASHAATPLDVIEALASDPEPYVRRAVAVNRVAPVPVLLALAADAEIDVPGVLALREDLPVEVYRALLAHAEPLVREGAVRSPGCPYRLRVLSLQDPDAGVRVAAGASLLRDD